MRFMSLMAISLLFLTTSVYAQDSDGADTARQIPADDVLVLELDTGTVYVELFSDVAPRHVEQIKTLAEQGFMMALCSIA
jgi:peptidylprolyl isomerase